MSCVRRLPELWRAPPARDAPAREGLSLPLHPLPSLRRARRLLLSLWALLGLELLCRGHWLAAPGMLTLAVLWWRWVRRPDPVNRFTRLVCTAAGTLWLMGPGGQEAVRLLPASIWLGPHVLLVLRGVRTYRLLLGPGNVPQATLAALRRRLRRAAGT